MTARASSDPSARPAAAPTIDGRLNRSVVTRKKIIDALTALVYEGCLAPTAEQVATKADVGLRTVFRHFEDMDSLYREMGSDLDAVVMPVINTRLEGATWRDKLHHSIELRATLYDRVAAMHLATQVHRHESGLLDRNCRRLVELQRERLRSMLARTPAADGAVFEALDAVLSIEVWIRLRREQGLTGAQARGVMRLAAERILGLAGP